MTTSTTSQNWQYTVECITGDAVRHGSESNLAAAVRTAMSSSTMRFQLFLRLVRYLHQNHRRSLRHVIVRVIYRRMVTRYGYEIPVTVAIGPGLLLRHRGPIVVHEQVTLGRNVNLNTGVVIGQSFRGPRQGVPTIGDNVYIGPGAKVIGAISVGNDVCIGANAVVTHDVDDHQVVGGVPAQVISLDGSAGYVRNAC